MSHVRAHHASCFTVFSLAILASLRLASTGLAAEAPTAGGKEQALQMFDLSPAIFVENRGQWDAEVRYAFQGKGINVFFTDKGPVFQVLQGSGDGEGGLDAAVIRARFVGANKASPEGLEAAGAKMNYYIGSDASKWRSGVPTFQKVIYRNAYDGIDLHVWGRRTGLKYEFHVAPGADWEKIRIAYEGTSGLEVDESGALCVGTPLGEMVDDAPVAWQQTASGRVAVECSYRLRGESSYGFEVCAGYDPSRALVIDPEIEWGTYLGGTCFEQASNIAIDAAGNAWVTGTTDSYDFPTAGGFDTSYGGNEAFVARITATGELDFASYLGGGSADAGTGIAVDSSGNAWVTGFARSSDFPTPGGFDTSYGGSWDAFVARITPAGTLAFGSYLGGNNTDVGYGIAIDTFGNAWVSGWTDSSDLPTPGGFDTSLGGGQDAFVARITPAGDLAFATYLGGSGFEWGYDMAIDTSGNAWVTGRTSSSDFTTPGGFDASLGGDQDAFVAKITSAGELAFASYLGGSGYDGGQEIAIDGSGNAWLTGSTQSSDFPTPGGFDTSCGGSSDAFVARITPGGELAFASYLGGNNADSGYRIAVDSSGNAWVTGSTQSSDFPTPRGFDTSPGGGSDAFVARITATGELAFASYLGGSNYDGGRGIAIDTSGNVWVAGDTESSDFPALGGFDTSWNGEGDAFIVKLTDTPDNTRVLLLLEEIGRLRVQLLSKLDTDKHDFARVLAYAYKGIKEDSSVEGGVYGFFSTVLTVKTAVDLLLRAPGAVVGAVKWGLSQAMEQWLESINEETKEEFDSFWNVLLSDVSLDPDDSIDTLASKIETKLAANDLFPYEARKEAVSNRLAALADYVRDWDDDPQLGDAAISQAVSNLSRTRGNILPSCCGQRSIAKWYSAGEQTFAFTEVGTIGPGAHAIEWLYEDYKNGVAPNFRAACWNIGGGLGAGFYVAGKVILTMVSGGTTIPVEFGLLGFGASFLGAGGMVGDRSAQGMEVQALRLIAAVGIISAGSAHNEFTAVEQIALDTDDYVRVLLDSPATLPAASISAGSLVMPNITLAPDVAYGSATGKVTFTAGGPATAKAKVFVEIGNTVNSERMTVSVANPDPVATAAGDHWQEFNYSALTAGAIGSDCLSSTGRAWVAYGTALTESPAVVFTVGSEDVCRLGAGLEYENVAQDGIHAGETLAYDYEVPVNAGRVDFALEYPGSDLDLHLVDPEGRHLGIDYETGLVEEGIPGASYSGSSRLPEVIIIRQPAPGTYVLKVVGVTVTGEEEPFTISAMTTPMSAFVRSLDGIVTVQAGKPRHNRKTGLSSVTVVMKNASASTVVTLVGLAVESVSDPGVSLARISGVTPEGKDYVEVAVPHGRLYPGKKVTKTIYFANPDGLAFTFEWAVRGAGQPIFVDSGEIGNLSVSPVHILEGEDALWPDSGVPPTFSWQNMASRPLSLCLDVSNSEEIVLTGGRNTFTLPIRDANGGGYALSKSQWKRARQLAAASGGVLYWRLRETKVRTVPAFGTEPRKVVVDGGTFTLSDLDLSAASPSVSWTHAGEGLVKYKLQFSIADSFQASTKFTIYVPSSAIAATTYTLSAADLKKLDKLAKTNSVMTLHYRVCGEDAEKAFKGYSSSKMVSIP